MALAQDEGFVIAATKYQESSLVVRCFLRGHGKLGIVARGARSMKSRLGSSFETFSRLKLLFFLGGNAEMGTLKEAFAEDYYPLLRADLDRFACASLFFEILDQGLPAHEPHPAVYDATLGFLEDMKRNDWLPGDSPRHFLSLVAGLGFAPSLERCGDCGNADGLGYFDCAGGRVLCNRCATGFAGLVPLSEDLRCGMIRASLPLSHIEPSWPAAMSADFFRLLRDLVEYHFDLRLRSTDFLLSQLTGNNPHH